MLDAVVEEEMSEEEDEDEDSIAVLEEQEEQSHQNNGQAAMILVHDSRSSSSSNASSYKLNLDVWQRSSIRETADEPYQQSLLMDLKKILKNFQLIKPFLLRLLLLLC